MNSIKRININPNDISKISKELILYITLKDGTLLISDINTPSQDINQLINNKQENIIKINNIKNSANYNFNYTNNEINNNNSFIKNEKVFSINHQITNDLNKFNKSAYNNNFHTLNPNKSSYKNIEENKNDIYYRNNDKIIDYKSQNQSISDIVNEKFQKKFKNNTKENKMPIKATINSEININIKGKENKHGLDNLLNDFNELLTNFNYKKKGMQNNSIDKNKYKYYKMSNMKKKDKLFLENLSSITPNSRMIKYIGRNENNITELNDKNILGINNTKNKVSYLKDKKVLKRNRSNHVYFLKLNKISNIISPPNYLHYKKIQFL